jgi:hypothetical protein
MPAGRPLLEHAALEVPPEAGSGPARVELVTGETTIVLGEVLVKAGLHIFNAPPVSHALNIRADNVATLLGYTLEGEDASASVVTGKNVDVRVGIPFTLTLVWRADAGAAETDLKVFTHLLDADGAIVAQHDAKPVAWTRPTGGWVPGEILVDQHELKWQRDYEGPAALVVGLYDADTGARVRWQDGQDALELPTSLMVHGSD